MRRGRLHCGAFVCLLVLGWPLVAAAQFTYRPGQTRASAVGEDYHVEISGDIWNPTPEMVISSEALGIVGTDIDLVEDLHLEKKSFRGFRLIVRPATKHKFRFSFTPISYETEALLERSIVFNGIRYDIGLPVSADLKWRAWRFGYEYDFLYRDRGYVGIIVEAKYTDVQTTLASDLIGSEFTHVRAPIPTIGFAARGYVASNVAITGEFTGFSLPDIDDDYDGHYFDLDLYASFNFADNFGVLVGYRSFDVEYRIEQDLGDFVLKGWYFGAAVRF